MAKYKTKPATVEAFQWNGYNEKTNPKWFTAAQHRASDLDGAARIVNDSIVHIIAAGRMIKANRGDYIIHYDESDLRVMSAVTFDQMFVKA